jgi:recombinational DNA repair protein RecR
MASEVKRSINLEYQADLKQLIAQLEKMPGITAQEAKKMVSVLDTNFRRAEKAAKRSQEASKKAAREAQRAFQEIDTRGARPRERLSEPSRR